jgi:DNA-binding CsgD family transcriptional regulator
MIPVNSGKLEKICKLSSSMDPLLSWEQIETIADRLVWQHSHKHLSDREMAVLEGSWRGLTYEAIAVEMNLSADYIHKDIGSALWQKLSEALGEKVSKQNFRQALQRHSRQTPSSNSPTRFPTGAVAADSPLYVQRGTIESECEQELLRPGALVRIKSPHMTGKTSLLNWLVDRLATHGFRAVRISLRQADRKQFQDIDLLLRWLSANVRKQLGLESPLEEYWDEAIGSMVSCTSYMQGGVLEQIDGGLLLAIDDIDVIFAYPELARDFLSLLREWHEESNFTDVWQQLRLVVVHTTEVYIALDLNQSPFNVGLPVQLPPLDLPQANYLAQLYGWSAPDSLEQLRTFLGGHPYLLQMALYHLSQQQSSLADFFQTAPTYNGIYGSHLRRYLAELQGHEDLLAAMKLVVESERPVPLVWQQLYRLDSMGLIRLVDNGNRVEPSCALYRQYFLNHL